jgi:flavin-dependent dehydrogenase
MYDCIVIGGGAAACTAATLVAAAGFRTLLLGCGPSSGALAGEPAAPEAAATLRRLGPSASAAIPAGGLGHWLSQNAAAHGVELRPTSLACEVLIDRPPGASPAAVGVRLSSSVAAPEDLAARVIVDARLTPAAAEPQSNAPVGHAALWAHYRGAQRGPGGGEGTAIVVPTCRQSWFWFAPLADGVTSVGVVFPAERLAGRDSPECVLEEELCDCPAVLERLIDAELASEFHVLANAPPLAPCVKGDGWLALPEATGAGSRSVCGLFLALKSGEVTADRVCRALRAGNLSTSQLGER